MNIPILYDSSYEKDSVWGGMLQSAIAKALLEKKYTSTIIDPTTYQSFDYDTLFSNLPRLLLVVASDRIWLEEAFCFFSTHDIQIVLVDSYPFAHPCIRGQVDCDHNQDIETILTLFEQCGCHRTALYGVLPTSSADYRKKLYFEQAMERRHIESPSTLCFANTTGLRDCYQIFHSRIEEFDSVICVNGFAAATLMLQLTADGFSVPEDIQIVTFGGVRLSDFSSTPISVMVTDTSIMAQHAVLTYRYLYNNHHFSGRINALIPGELTIRESTKVLDAEPPAVMPPSSSEETSPYFFNNDKDVQYLVKFEKLLVSCDSIDTQILKQLCNGNSYEKMSQSLHLSKNAVYYRIKRMKDIVEIGSIEEFREFLARRDDYIG